MREILFRGKRLDSGEWAEGAYKEEKVGKYLTAVFITEKLTDRVYETHRVDPETVGQYTRIRDDHLKPLFEGDICRAKNLLHNGKEELFAVEWYANGFYFVDDTGTPWHPHHLEDIKNIGNIHDNPELLGGA